MKSSAYQGKTRLGNLRLFRVRVLAAAAMFCMLAVLPASADVAWDAGTDDLARKISFVIQGAGSSEPLSGFPVLVKLYNGLGEGFRYSDMRADGSDMAFTLEDGTPLPHDVDTWNPGGDSYVWVRIPSLVNGLVFKLHYGGSPRTSSAQSVWTGYTGVWHMNETDGAAAAVADSSANGLAGTGGDNSIATADGVFGGARGTRTSGRKKPIFSTPYSQSLDDVGTAFTVSGWIRAAGAPDWAYLFARKSSDSSNGWGLQFRGNANSASPTFYFNSSMTGIGSKFPLAENEWIKFDATYNSSNVAFYANGQLVGTGRNTTCDYAEHGTLGLQIGGLAENGYGTFNGDMDEVRYSSGVKSAAWIAAEYATMHSPETFLAAEYEDSGVLPPKAFEKYVPLKVSGYAGASTLANFPVLVRVSESAMPGFSYAEAGGRTDVRFTDSEGRYLKFECDTWNPSGESLFWVSVPELSGTETELRLYFGRHPEVPVSGKEKPNLVWSQAGYAGVFHMDVSSNNKVADSCLGVKGDVVHAVSTMPGASGLIGGGYMNPEWQATAPRIDLAADDSGYGQIRAALTNASACSFSLWVKNDGGTGNGTYKNYGYLLHHDRYDENHRFETCLESNPTLFTVRDTGGEFKKSCIDLSDRWHLVTLCYEGASRHVYFDGVENANFTSDAAGYNPDPAKKLIIGCNDGGVDCQWVGGIDEVRFRAAATSTDWMLAEVANVTNASFITSGPVKLSNPPKGLAIIVR